MDNKTIFFVDKNFNFSKHSVEFLHSNELNKWKGWHCSIGLRTLYIDFDGNAFRGTCGEGKWLGNVNAVSGLNSDSHDLQNNIWVECTKNICSCGADMAVPKVKKQNLIYNYFKDSTTSIDALKIQEEQPIVNPMIVTSNDYNLFKSVIWDLGRRCNFDCWYCAPNSHNNYATQMNFDMLENSYNTLNNWWMKDERTKFSITGGEPTVYKDYLPFVKFLKEKDHIINTTTNGSNTPAYYAELAEYSDIVFSIHLNYVKKLGLEKFLSAVEASLITTEKGFENDTVARFNHIIVRVMLDPGNLEIAKESHNTFKDKFCKYKNFLLSVDVVHEVHNKELLNYTQEELEWVTGLGN
jgi:organic radical activating enzyme